MPQKGGGHGNWGAEFGHNLPRLPNPSIQCQLIYLINKAHAKIHN